MTVSLWPWCNRIQRQIYRSLPAFKSRNFRLYVLGQIFSLSGTFMTQISIPWLVYDLTHSAWLLGLTGFLMFLPTLLLVPFSGVLSDRYSRRDLLRTVQFMGMSVSLTLTGLTFTGLVNWGSLVILGMLVGLIKGLDMPIRHAFVVEMVEDKGDLANGIALNSAMLSSSRLIGPALGGLLIASFGVQACFLFDSLSYLPAIAVLAAMRLAPNVASVQTQSTWQKLQEGFFYIIQTPPILHILMLLSLQGIFGMTYMAMLPIFAADILQSGPETFGFLGASAAVGSVLACLYLSLRQGVGGLVSIITLCPAVIGLGLIAFAVSRSVGLSALILVLVGGVGTLQVASSNTIVQVLVDDDKRGRVMSFHALAFMGMMPISNLISGGLAHLLGAQNTLLVSGMAVIGASVWFSRHWGSTRQWVATATAVAPTQVETAPSSSLATPLTPRSS